jgi:NAD(P)-dependent dehydrogenase (short-subunit alcohol dehydrogenase family)
MAERAVFVTGAAQGIGRASAELFLERGWHVLAADLKREGLEAFAAERPGAALSVCAMDVTDAAGIERAAAACAELAAPLAAVVNCAGIGGIVPLMETDPETMRRLYEVNVVGQLAVSQALIPQLRERGGGGIVHVASVSGIQGSAGRTAYGTAKGGLITLTKIMAVELAAAGVRVNAVAPGPIDTPQALEFHTSQIREEWTSRVPLRRYGTPAEVARPIAFLADDEESGYMTGQVLAVDGGFTSAGLLG